MTEGFTCPAEGCDYGAPDDESKSLAATRAHINASNDDAHDWGQLKPALYQQAEDAEKAASEPADGDEQEPAEEQGEASENAENDEQEMPTDEEYEQQYEDDDEDDQGDDQTTGTTSSSGGGPSLPVSTTTLVVFAVVAGLLVALYLRGGEDTADVTDADVDVDDTEDDADAGENTADVVGMV